jgi:hypothetical protein
MVTSGRTDGGRKPPRERTASRPSRSRGRPGRARRPGPPPPEPADAVEPPAIAVTAPEAAFRERVPPAPPERPRPAGRRAIFLDVENTSKPQHLAHIIDHLAVDRRDAQTDLVAVANWRVVGQECARLLAQRGAQLVHSAPSTGVRDWSDLRIAVTAGIWLAAARSGDVIEIVSDDRAFDAVGDVAASLGITFRRLSYRHLARQEAPLEAPVAEAVPHPAPEPRGTRRRRRGRGPRGAPAAGEAAPPRGRAPAAPPPPREERPAPAHAEAPRRAAAAHAARGPAEGHTAPHDELVAVVRELVEASPRRSVVLDVVANALKARGFQRPPGSPRLVTRLRRIRELVVSPSGVITLAEDAMAGRVAPDVEPGEPAAEGLDAAVTRRDGGEPAEPEAAPGAEGARPGGPRGRRRRRRRRRGTPRPTTDGAPAV